MKIAGVGRQGKRRGVIKELDDDIKVVGALKDAVVEYSESSESGKYLNFVRDVAVSKLDVQLRGAPLKGKFKNNNYFARGRCVVHFRDRKSGKVRPKRDMKFHIKFHDILDRQGLPDLKVSDLELT